MAHVYETTKQNSTYLQQNKISLSLIILAHDSLLLHILSFSIKTLL